MVRLFVCIDLLGVVHTMTRHQKTRPEIPEKRPTPDSTTAHQKSHRDSQRHTAKPDSTHSQRRARRATQQATAPHQRQRHHTADTMPDAPQASYSHFNAIKPLYTIKP